MKNGLLIVGIAIIVSSCAVAKKYNPAKKFSPQQLQSDYTIFRNILEESHPGLYWYTSKDSMDDYFGKGKSLLQDSLTETKFRNVLTYVIAQMRCGHTSVMPSKAGAKYAQRVRIRSFPLNFKIWQDTTVVTSSFNPNDSNLLKSVVTAIDGRPLSFIIDSFFHHLSADGYNTTHKYQTLSSRGVFATMYNNAFGLRKKYLIDYTDTSGVSKTTYINLFTPVADTTKKLLPKPLSMSRHERKKLLKTVTRSLRMDTTLQTGFMDLNTFVKGYQLHHFFKQSFKRLKNAQAQNLVIDLRNNGGGSVTNSTILTKYIANEPFKIADSLYAITRSSRYGQYQQNHFWNRLFLFFLTHRKSDGHYHFTYFEKHYFKPVKHHHFDGQVYVLTGGNTFSASTLFIQSVKEQKNVTVVGEETGGGSYGNTAWLIPDITLPNTGVRFRLPLFRLVMNKNYPKTGHGIIPNVQALPTVKAIRRGVDFKMEKVMELIKNNKGQYSDIK